MHATIIIHIVRSVIPSTALQLQGQDLAQGVSWPECDVRLPNILRLAVVCALSLRITHFRELRNSFASYKYSFCHPILRFEYTVTFQTEHSMNWSCDILFRS